MSEGYFTVRLARGEPCAMVPGEEMGFPAPAEGDDSILIEVESEHRGKFGVQFNENGTISFGTWNNEGEWVDLHLMAHDGFSSFIPREVVSIQSI